MPFEKNEDLFLASKLTPGREHLARAGHGASETGLIFDTDSGVPPNAVPAALSTVTRCKVHQEFVALGP